MSNTEINNADNLLTGNDFEDFLIVQEKIHQKAEEILKEINEIKKIEGYSYLHVKNIDSSEIEFYGEEYYCGSYDSYEFSIPSYLIYDNDGKEKYLEKLRNEESEKLRKKEEQLKIEKDMQVEREKKLLVDLQLKYLGRV